MKAQGLQGLALILSAVCLLLRLVGSNTTLFQVIALLGILLLILGISAIYSTGWLGRGDRHCSPGTCSTDCPRISIGRMAPSSIGSNLSLTSAILGMLGAVIVGWLTIRAHVFPAWVGWVFIAQGLLNFLAGLFSFGSLTSVLSILLPVLQAVALLAYGYFIYQIQ